MLQFRLLAIAILTSTLLIAQRADTSVFFRNASTFDQLLPNAIYPMADFLPDSSSLAIFNGEVKGKKLEKHVTSEHRSQVVQSWSDVGTWRYAFDYEGRLTKFTLLNTKDSSVLENTRVQFLIGNKAADVYHSASLGNALDTLSFTYNRSGWVGSWRYHSVTTDSNSLQLGNCMYNSQGKLIVATGQNYGPLKGVFLFDYNSLGQITRRAFATDGGIMLCVDTLIYEYQNEARSILRVAHKLKVTGMQNWQLLEEKTIYAVSGKVISYTDYNDADENYLYRNYVQYSIRYEYDDRGRISGEYFGSITAPDAIRVKYYYGTEMQPDSIVYEEQVVAKKTTYYRTYQRDVRLYDEKSKLITFRTVTTILFEEKKKKEKFPPIEVIRTEYTWK